MNIIKENEYDFIMENQIEPELKRQGKDYFVQRNRDQKIHYVYYKAEHACGTIVISHGFTESAEKYKEMAYYFLQASYHVCIIEHCGHGLSYRLTDDMGKVHIDRYERYIEDFAFVVKKLQKQTTLPIYLYAHSMGGAIGALTAGKYPELFQKIILTSPMIQPLTGTVPWSFSKTVSWYMVKRKKGEQYVIGQHGYQGLERFEDGFATSKMRFMYYNRKKAENPAFQTNGASYNWLYQTTRMYKELMKYSCKKIKAPIWLFQAENENIVSLSAQTAFIDKMRKNGNCHTKISMVKDAKHEIYQSGDSVLENYIKDVLAFFDKSFG